MKIGDKVRFLNAVGGGVITQFQDKNIVVVLEDDGFETPVLATEIVVLQPTNQYNFPTSENVQQSTGAGLQPVPNDEEKKDELQTRASEYVFNEENETPQGEKINLFFAFVPLNIKQLQTSEMEFYLINDSNFYVNFQLLAGNQKSTVIISDTIEPQTKILLQNIEKEQVNDYEMLRFQGFAFKEHKIFDTKPSIDVTLKINPVDFYKLHCFKDNDFFDDNAMIISVLENDFPPLKISIKPEQLQAAMEEKAIPQTKITFAPPKKEEILEIDLHINELVDSTLGMDNGDMLTLQLNKFHAVMKENLKNRGQKIVFIHGKGEGVLRKEIEAQLKRSYKTCYFQDASFQQYGFGATQVTVR
ncbi:MAG: DUF2027 domain-containing protein [Prevotellaceae bacterium]|jgi:hypothetical protein|nr:DUF2027 domain-containing protein [Prevotellaceae bacterium]